MHAESTTIPTVRTAPMIPDVPESLRAEVTALLAQLTQKPLDPIPPGDAGASLLPVWMIETILKVPEDTVRFLQSLREANYPQEVYQRSARPDPHRAAEYIFNAIKDRNPEDRDGNRDFIARLMMGLGIFGGLAMLAGMAIALILLKLGPVGVVLGLIAVIFGFLALLAAVAIMLVLQVVLALIGGKLEGSVAVELKASAPLGAG